MKARKKKARAKKARANRTPGNPDRPWYVGGAVAVALGLLVMAIKLSSTFSRPEIAMLMSKNGAQWIGFDAPIDLRGEGGDNYAVGFRKQIAVTQQPAKAALRFTAFKVAQVRVDGVVVGNTGKGAAHWRTEREADLAPRLTPGAHEISFIVTNPLGPKCIRAYSDALNLVTDGSWESTMDGRNWVPARSVDGYRPLEIAQKFKRADKALLAMLPFLIPLFLAVFGLSFWIQRTRHVADFIEQSRGRHAVLGYILSVAGLRWFFVAAWVVLALNNITKLAPHIGFDIDGHIEYIKLVVEERRLPLATEGWTMFQAPLYYLVSVPLYLLLNAMMKPETVMQWLRIVPLACGIAQIEISYRALRYLWPDRKDLQAFGVMAAAFFPMNVYMSQYVGNEPAAGAAVAIVVTLCLRFLRHPARGRTMRAVVTMGLCLGLATLAKATAVMLAPLLALMVVYATFTTGESKQRTIANVVKPLAIIFSVAFVVAGWFYVQNWIALGRPFFAGWEPERGLAWWQYPGFRTPKQFYSFGEALFYPMYSSVHSFWNGIHSSLWMDGYLGSETSYENAPGWNFDFVLSSVWLAFIPIALMAAGLYATFRRPDWAARQGLMFMVMCLGLYFTALLYGYLTVQMYCITKATYTLGLLPCYAALITAGMDWMGRKPALRATCHAALVCWALSSYCAYFIVHPALGP